MESLRGIFPHQPQLQPKRDFLKENVLRIKNMQRLSKTSKNKSEYTNKYSAAAAAVKPVTRQRKQSTCDNLITITNLRKSVSSMSIGSREIATQTIDPEKDEYFLKDTIIRYPSASTIRSLSAFQQNQASSTCSRGHTIVDSDRSRSKTHLSDSQLERHLSNFNVNDRDKGAAKTQKTDNKKPTSILKSSSLLKLNKNSINETQQREDRLVSASQRSARIETVDISDDNESEEGEVVENKKELVASQIKERGDGDNVESKKQQQIKAAASDPECPDGHVPLSEEERLDALKIAKKRFKFLVDDLNRLPMTSETLRVRNRKIEIEKELRALEINIRVFSRTKVYVKLE